VRTQINGSYLGLKGNALVMTFTETIGQGVLYLTSAFWSLYVLELGASLAMVGLLGFIQGLIRVFLQAPVGYLTDKKGHKRLVVWGGFIASFAPFVYLFANNWVYLIPGVILEAFTNVVLPARQAMFAFAIDPDKRATAFAAIHTFFAVASSVLPVVGGYMLEWMGLIPGMRLAFLLSGIVMLVASAGRALYLREDFVKGDVPYEEFSFKRVMVDIFEPILTLKALKIALLGAFLFSMAAGILTRYSVVYAVDIIGLSKVEWGLVAGGMGVVGILTRIPIGRMIDRFSRKMCIFLSYATRPVVILAFAQSTTFLQVLITQMLDNVFGYIQQPALEAFVVDVAPTAGMGRAYGALSMIPGISLTVSPMIGAFIWESAGAPWAFYASASFIAVAAAIILVRLQEPKKEASS